MDDERFLGRASLASRHSPQVGPLSHHTGCWPLTDVFTITVGIGFIIEVRSAYAGRVVVRALCGTCRTWRLLFLSAVDAIDGRHPRLLFFPCRNLGDPENEVLVDDLDPDDDLYPAVGYRP